MSSACFVFGKYSPEDRGGQLYSNYNTAAGPYSNLGVLALFNGGAEWSGGALLRLGLPGGVVGDEGAAEIGEGAGFDVGADALHEVEVEMEVVQ